MDASQGRTLETRAEEPAGIAAVSAASFDLPLRAVRGVSLAAGSPLTAYRVPGFTHE